MIIQDIREEFYSVIKGKRVLVVVNYDVDAICACKILQLLFRTDCTLYTLVPVDITSDLKLSVTENLLDEKYIIFINCGGTTDLEDDLQLEGDITLFVLDSHRPLDVCNIYNPSQVRLISKPGPYPRFEDIFSDGSDQEDEYERKRAPKKKKKLIKERAGEQGCSNNNEECHDNDDEVEEEEDGVEDKEEEEEEENDDDNDNVDNPQSKRRLTEEYLLKRERRRLWETRRDELLFEYTKFSYYGRSSALEMYDLAWTMSKDNLDILWYSILGLSEQLLMRKISETDYVFECGNLQSHASRLNFMCCTTDDGRSTSVRIDFEKDLRLALMRHWTIKSSLTYSVFTATRLQLWTFQGEKKLHEMFAEIGIPLVQCKQKFASMDLVFRREFKESLEKITDKYSLNGILFISFFIQHGYRAKYSAMDFVYSLIAHLQSQNEERSKSDCFLDCLEALCRTKQPKIDWGIDMAKKLLTSIFKHVQNALETKQIQCSGPFLYLVIQEGNVDSNLFNHPYGLLLLAEFAFHAFTTVSKSTKYQKMPFLISMPIVAVRGGVIQTEENAICHIAALAPQGRNSNFWGRAFKKAAENAFSPIKNVYFDPSVIQIHVKDRGRFLDALAVLLSDN